MVSGTVSSNGPASQLSPAPDPTASTAPDGTPLGKDISNGGKTPAYGSPGGGGTAGSGGGYTANGSQHATGGNYVPGTPNKNVPAGLGGLSQQYESGGKGAGAIGQDSTGGYSYGTYQIATNTGTMNNYMSYLQQNNPDEYAKLQAAGGANAARAGDPNFQNTWKDMAANDPAFAQSQHDFIQSSHYDPAAANIKAQTGLDVSTKSLGVQNAIWSTAVQNGPNSAVFTNAFAGKDVSKMSDTDIVNAIYDERGKTNGNGGLAYFSSSTPAVQQSVANRFVSERQGALNQISTPIPQAAIGIPIPSTNSNNQLGV